MQRHSLELKNIFRDLIKGFGLNHGKIYYVLLSSEVKTAKQVIEGTGINQATTYSVLRDLLKWGLIKYSNTNPTSYYVDDPLKNFEQHVKRKERLINSKKRLLEEVIAKDSLDDEKYLIKIGKGKQTKLFNILTKKELRYREELVKVKQSLDTLLKEAPEKERRSAYAYCMPR